MAAVHSRRHVEDGRGVRPVFGEVENDVDDFIWQIPGQREVVAEGDDGGHGGAFPQVDVGGLFGVGALVGIAGGWGEGEGLAGVFGVGNVDRFPLFRGA